MILDFVRILVFAGLVAAASLAGITTPAYCQDGSLAHFVAPSYPPIARQAMISGMVTLTLSVSREGAVTGVKEWTSGHGFLSDEAQSVVRQWRFHERQRSYSVGVTMYFSFSGTTREVNPKTSIKADFGPMSVRVFVITDAVPTSHP